MTSSPPRLSKSRFVTGCQCHKLLWWTVHEPDAPELQPDRCCRTSSTRAAWWARRLGSTFVAIDVLQKEGDGYRVMR